MQRVLGRFIATGKWLRKRIFYARSKTTPTEPILHRTIDSLEIGPTIVGPDLQVRDLKVLIKITLLKNLIHCCFNLWPNVKN